MKIETPCDVPIEEYDDNGNKTERYECPFLSTYMGSEGEMCRNCCGLGVDE